MQSVQLLYYEYWLVRLICAVFNITFEPFVLFNTSIILVHSLHFVATLTLWISISLSMQIQRWCWFQQVNSASLKLSVTSGKKQKHAIKKWFQLVQICTGPVWTSASPTHHRLAVVMVHRVLCFNVSACWLIEGAKGQQRNVFPPRTNKKPVIFWTFLGAVTR